MKGAKRAILLGSGCLLPSSALAAGAGSPPAAVWGVPFAGMLLSIALIPMLAPRFWHRRMSLVALGWSLALLVPLAAGSGVGAALATASHALLAEYLPFVALLLALYTTAGGVLVRGAGAGGPGGNTALLAVGTVMAGMVGTTGAAMVLIHPFLASNAHRTRKTHLVVFFIALVANAGGALTPLGDPPLYIGYLHGVPFAWPPRHLALPLLAIAAPLLAAFYAVDRWFAATERAQAERERFRLRGVGNIALIGVVVATVLATGSWHGGEVSLLGVRMEVGRIAGVGVFLAVAAISAAATPRAVRQANMFSWHPMQEVAVLFAAIFVTITPVLAMLEAGFHGPLAPLLRITVDAGGHPVPLAYFWLTGLLSAFLDNAPTYLVFFGLAGDNAATMTGPLNHVLVAISTGAVFFGALTYIGNAPNLMLRAIAAHRGVRMPDFFGYMAWSCGLLLPCFVLISFLFFR